MKNNVLGWGILISLGLSVVATWAGAGDADFTIIGSLICFFGIWGGIRLIKSND